MLLTRWFFAFAATLWQLARSEANALLPVLAWGADANNPIYTTAMNETLLRLLLEERNITEVLMTDSAVALRVGRPDEDFSASWETWSTGGFPQPHEKTVADGERSLAYWVVLGNATTGGELNNATIERLEHVTLTYEDSDGNTVSEKYCEETACWAKGFLANDLCAVSTGFAGIANYRAFCIGSADFCEAGEWELGASGTPAVDAIMCGTQGQSALMLMDGTGSGNFVAFVGQHWDSAPTNDTDVQQITPSNRPQAFAANSHAAAVLLQGGTLVTWGDADYGGAQKVDFVTSLASNDKGFAGTTTLGYAVTVPESLAVCLPARVQRDGGAVVAAIHGSNECFVGILNDGSLASWGLGEQLFCCEEGASNSDKYQNFNGIAEGISNVTDVHFTEDAIAARNDDGSVVAWGNVTAGGKVTDSRVRDAAAKSIFATHSTFGFVRKDGMIVVWGSDDSGAGLDNSFAQLGAVQMTSSNDGMAAIFNNGNLYRWPGTTAAYLSVGGEEGFALGAPAKALSGGRAGIVVILGRECDFSDWSAWSECTAACGGGTQHRTRQKTSDSLNAACTGATSETQKCNEATCEEETNVGLADIPPKVWLFASVGVVAAVGAAYFCCCTRHSSGDEEFLIS